MRSSIEGLNQEIEGLVLKSSSNSNDPDHQVEDKVSFVKKRNLLCIVSVQCPAFEMA